MTIEAPAQSPEISRSLRIVTGAVEGREQVIRRHPLGTVELPQAVSESIAELWGEALTPRDHVARIISESPWRAVIVGSSSWSHASLTKKNYFLWPDVDADRKRFAELESGQQANWRDLTAEELVDSGQHEMLNWVCLAGAMHGRRAQILSFAEAYIFNSSKCVALFPTST